METEHPDDFKCPISLELMKDPVILTSGHTFDRNSIQKWLHSGNRTCPVSKIPLPQNPTLIPNHALRSLISSYKSKIDISNHSNSTSPSFKLGDILKNLSFPTDPNSLNKILELTKNKPHLRQHILDAGVASSVILKHAGCNEKADTQEAALRIILDLSLYCDDAKVGLVADGLVDFLVSALKKGSCNSQALAATILTSLALLQVNKCTIGGHPMVISELVEVLRKGKGRAVRESATAIFVLCSFHENRRRAVRCGAVPVLVKLAGIGIERAIEVLEVLGKVKEGREEMERMDGLVGVLVALLRSGSSRGVADALSLMNLLCGYSSKMRNEAIEAGVMEVCEGLLGESGEIEKNASVLMGTLNFFLASG